MASNVSGGPTTIGLSGSGALGFAYVTNFSLLGYYNGSTGLSRYSIGIGGALSLLGSATTGSNPGSVVATPNGAYLYVVNTGEGTVSQYSIGPNGTLAPLLPAKVNGGGNFAIVDPLGRYLYVANGVANSNTIWQYSIGIDGLLTPLNPPSVSTGNYTPPQTEELVVYQNALAVDPNGTYVYATTFNGNNISQFSIGSDGSLSNMTTVTTGKNPAGIVVDPTDHYVYVANISDDTVSQYAIGVSGALSPLNPSTVATGSGPGAIAIDPSGKFVFVGNAAGETISQYAIGPGGALSVVGAPIAFNNVPTFLKVDPTSSYLYATGSGGVGQFSISANGTLSGPPPPQWPGGGTLNPQSIATVY